MDVLFYESNYLINITHKSSLRLIPNDHESSLVELFRENTDAKNHQRNIQILLRQVLKVTKVLSPPITGGIFNHARPKITTTLEIFRKL